MQEQLGVNPFLDIGSRSRYEWPALGWLDWQILLIICNIVVQWQVQRILGLPVSDETLPFIQRSSWERMKREEREEDPIFDIDAFNEPAIRDQKATLIMLVLEQQWGLKNCRKTPDFDAIQKMLSLRYGLFTDDVEHVDPFPGL